MEDEKFFPKSKISMEKEAVTKNVPYIAGCNSTEGHGIMTLLFPKQFSYGITKEAYYATVKGFLGGSFYVSLMSEIHAA